MSNSRGPYKKKIKTESERQRNIVKRKRYQSNRQRDIVQKNVTITQTTSKATVRFLCCNRLFFNANKIGGSGLSNCRRKLTSKTHECASHRILRIEDCNMYGCYNLERIEGLLLKESVVIGVGLGVFTSSKFVLNENDVVCFYEEETTCPVSAYQFRHYSIQPRLCTRVITGVMAPVLFKGLGSFINSAYNTSSEPNCYMLNEDNRVIIYDI
jgi:hypothetical protein